MAAPVEPEPAALATLQGGQFPLQPQPPAEANQVPVVQDLDTLRERSRGIFGPFFFAFLYIRFGPSSTRLACSPVLSCHRFATAAGLSVFSRVGLTLSRGFGGRDFSQRWPNLSWVHC